MTYQYILYYNPFTDQIDVTWYDETLKDHISKHKRFSAFSTRTVRGAGMFVVKEQNTYIHTSEYLTWRAMKELTGQISVILPTKNKHSFLGTIKDLEAEYPEAFI